jgi:hypothetical protein
VLQTAIYSLCFLASAGCAWLLARSFGRTRSRLLLWSAASFFLIALNNFFVVVDLVLIPSLDLMPLRRIASLAAVAVLLYGFIWETE